MFRTAIAALTILTSATAASAGSVELTRPIQAMSLHDGGIDMVVYYLDHDDHFEVVATYASKAAPADPGRIRMALRDGDAARFGLPGHRGLSYAFSRHGETVLINAQPVGRTVAALAD